MSQSGLHDKLKYNMEQMQNLRKHLQNLPFKNKDDIPTSENLPRLKPVMFNNTKEMDHKELDLLRKLVTDDDLSVIQDIMKYRNIPVTAKTKKDVLDHYKFNNCRKSNFRINAICKVSYKNGFFYDITEDNNVIIDNSCEVIPAIKSNIKTMCDTELHSFIASNSISVLACDALNPKMVSIHTPYK